MLGRCVLGSVGVGGVWECREDVIGIEKGGWMCRCEGSGSEDRTGQEREDGYVYVLNGWAASVGQKSGLCLVIRIVE